MRKNARRLAWLVVIFAAAGVGLLLHSMYAGTFQVSQSYYQTSLTDGPEGQVAMWCVHLDDIGATGDHLYGTALSTGQSEQRGDEQMKVQKDVTIDVYALDSYSRFPQSHYPQTFSALRFCYGCLLAIDQVKNDLGSVPVYTYSYGTTTTQYRIVIKAGGNTVLDQVFSYDYTTPQWTSVSTGAGTIYIRNNGQVNNGIIADVSNTRYFAVVDRDGATHSYLTNEGSLESLIVNWNAYLASKYPHGGVMNTACTGECAPIVSDWNARLPASNMWTILEWGDLKGLLGAQNYWKHPEQYQSLTTYCRTTINNQYLQLDYLAGQISPSIEILLPLSLADTLVTDLTPCDQAPVLNSVSLSNPAPLEGDIVQLNVQVTNPSSDSCIYTMHISAGSAQVYPRGEASFTSTFGPHETRTLQYDVNTPNIALQPGQSTDIQICAVAAAGVVQSTQRCVTLRVIENSPVPSISATAVPSTAGPTPSYVQTTAPTPEPTTITPGSSAFPTWIIIALILLIVVGVGGGLLLGGKRRRRRR